MFSEYSSPYLVNKFLVPEGHHGFWSFSNIFEKRGVNEGVFQFQTSPLDAAKYSKYYTLAPASVRQIKYIQDLTSMVISGLPYYLLVMCRIGMADT